MKKSKKNKSRIKEFKFKVWLRKSLLCRLEDIGERLDKHLEKQEFKRSVWKAVRRKNGRKHHQIDLCTSLFSLLWCLPLASCFPASTVLQHHSLFAVPGAGLFWTSISSWAGEERDADVLLCITTSLLPKMNPHSSWYFSWHRIWGRRWFPDHGRP